MTPQERLIQRYQKSYEQLLKRIAEKSARGSWTGFESQLLKEIERAVAELDQAVVKELPSLVDQSWSTAASEAADVFAGAGITPKLGAGLNRRAMTLIIQNAVDTLVQANHYFGRHVHDRLRQVGLDAVAEKLSTGQTIPQAKRRIMETLTTEGLQAPVGSSGRPMRLESYAALVARTTTREATNTATMDTTTQYGHDLVKFTSHYPTCDVCAPLQGRVFSISGKDTRFPALSSVPGFDHGFKTIHPNCRHVLAPVVWELCSEEEKTKYLADSGKPVKGDTRSQKEVDAYNAAQAKNRQLWADRRQYEKYKATLGDKAPGTFANFRRLKYNNSEQFAKLTKIYKQTNQLNWEADVLARHSKIEDFKVFEKPEDIPQWAHEQINLWTDDEQAALTYYTSHEFSKINEYLRGRISAGPGITEKIELITSAIEKTDIQENIVLWRGTSLSGFKNADQLRKLPLDSWPGERLDDDAFSSTAMVQSGAFDKEVNMQILVPQNQKGAFINAISEFKDDEYEMLLQKGSMFRILEAEARGGKYFLTVLYEGGMI